MRYKIYSILVGIFSISFFFPVNANKILVTNINARYDLPRNTVNCMFQDSKGFLWFGMPNGLYKFDLNNFSNVSSLKNNRLAQHEIQSIVEYTPGVLLIGTFNKGLFIYNTITEEYSAVKLNQSIGFSESSIRCLHVDKAGIIWIGTSNGLFRIKQSGKSPDTFSLLNQFNTKNSAIISNDIVNIKQSKTGVIWILTMSDIGYFDPSIQKIKTFQTYGANSSFIFFDEKRILISCLSSGIKLFNTETFKLEQIQINDLVGKTKTTFVYKDQQSNVWLGISNVGLLLWNAENSTIPPTIISNKTKEYVALNSNIINQIYESKDGTLWICTEEGINVITMKPELFKSYSCIVANYNSKFPIEIRSLNSSNKDFLWVGTMGNGLKQFNITSNTFFDIPLLSENKPIGKNIQAIINDHLGNIWLGTEGEGVIKFTPNKNSNFKTGKIINYRLYPKAFPAKTILNDYIMCLLEDSRHNIWIGTWYGLSLIESSELEKPDQSKITIINFLNNRTNNYSISNTTIMNLMEDRDGNIWAGTVEGLNKITKSLLGYKFEHYFKSDKGISITEKKILAIHQSKDGNIWFASQDGGISLLNTKTGIFKEYNSQTGFNDNIFCSIDEDSSGNLWLGSNNGLCRFNTSGFSFKNYTTEDGLVSNSFSFGSSCHVNNYLFFGSVNNLTAFDPNALTPSSVKPNLTFTDFRLFNKPLDLNSKESPLKQHISTVNSVTLKHNQNFITIAFATLNYKQQKEIQYSCILEGLETSWNNLLNEHKITYNSLPPGHYIFRVKAYSSNDNTNASNSSLEIIVKPPFWKTIWALLFYTVLIAFLLFQISQHFINKEKRESVLALERLNAKNIHEIDLMRFQFFTNISHEFRTPLTLISAPLESLIKEKTEPEKARSYYQLMLKNVQRLTRLINQLLDLRKIEEGYLKMEWNQDDIIDFIKKTFTTFQNYADKREINFTFQSGIPQLFSFFDADKLDKILFNLLSNAFKYTSNFGTISLSLEKKRSSEVPFKGSNKKYLEIKLTDTGFGIPKDSIDKIFDPFHQINNNRPIGSAATGIGLSLTKELIILHNGIITVESELNKGSCFTVYLPIFESNPQNNPETEINKKPNAELTEIENIATIEQANISEKSNHISKPMVLIVEDNYDLRTFIKGELLNSFRIIEAADGIEGFEQAIQKTPDLIVSDIMMDKMDGIDLCKKIKLDERTSHIPIILLTARHSNDIKLSSFEIGADDYITKPFNTHLLHTRINNLIDQRRKLRTLFNKGNNLDFSAISTNNTDIQFLEKLKQEIEKNLTDSDFDPAILASNMAMSRMQLYRKVSALTNQTVYNLIRTIRLNTAAQLLISSDMQISEISEKVGFTEASNFTKSFLKQFNQTPSQFVRSNRK